MAYNPTPSPPNPTPSSALGSPASSSYVSHVDLSPPLLLLTELSLYYKLVCTKAQKAKIVGRHYMKNQDREEQRITSEDAWESIHATLDRSRSLMYVAGWPSILLLWGVIVSVGYLTQFVVETAFTTFADDYPWFPGPLWGVLGTIGMIGSSILGHRAGHANSDGPTATRAGLQVFFFWMTVVTAAYIIPAASGLYSY